MGATTVDGAGHAQPVRHDDVMAGESRLRSWNDGAAKSEILDFGARTTVEGGRDYVPLEQRIATFDNDGTPWCLTHSKATLKGSPYDRRKTLAHRVCPPIRWARSTPIIRIRRRSPIWIGRVTRGSTRIAA